MAKLVPAAKMVPGMAPVKAKGLPVDDPKKLLDKAEDEDESAGNGDMADGEQLAMVDSTAAAAAAPMVAAAAAAQDGGSDDGDGVSAAPVAIGAALLAGGAIVILAGGGNEGDTPVPPPPPPPPPPNTAPAFGAAPTVTTDEDTAVDGTVTATDAEGQTITYSFGGAVGGTVVADGTTGGFTFTPDADFEGDATFVATATDSAGASSTQTVTVTVAGVNDPSVFTSGTTATVAENDSTTVVYTAVATDVDGGEITYSLGDGGDSDMFAIDPETGEVTLVAPGADFETDSELTFEVIATEGGVGTSQTVTVTVTDVDDGPPPPNEVSIDVGTAAQNGAAQLDAGGESDPDVAYSFNDDVTALTNVAINNFGENDYINLDSDDYSFASSGGDIEITLTENGVLNTILLVDAVDPDAFINDEGDANAALNAAFGTTDVDFFNTPGDPLAAAALDSFSVG